MINVRTELPQDAEIIRKLLDLAFGPDRYRKTVYRLREGILPIRSMCFVAEYMNEVRGSLRFWPILIGDDLTSPAPGLLLGPLAVDPGIRGRGVGEDLMRKGIEVARANSHERIILVGDPEYYTNFGFREDLADALILPGPVDRHRFLGLELVPGAFDQVSGMIHPAPQVQNRSQPIEVSTPVNEDQTPTGHISADSQNPLGQKAP